jgi:hypothetical protein
MKKIAFIFLLCAFSLSAPDFDNENDVQPVPPVLVLPPQFLYDSPPAAQIIPELVVAPGAPVRRRLSF